MKKINSKFIDLAIKRNNLLLFNKENALLIIEQCNKLGLRVFDIDALHLESNWIQPYSKFSFDNSKVKS